MQRGVLVAGEESGRGDRTMVVDSRDNVQGDEGTCDAR